LAGRGKERFDPKWLSLRQYAAPYGMTTPVRIVTKPRVEMVIKVSNTPKRIDKGPKPRLSTNM
jgi:hypothetical protein